MNTFVRRSRRRVTALAALVVALAAVVALGYVAQTARGSSRDTITLHVSLFGDFGYHDLYKQYEAAHPNIDIK
jgi:cellobiose transport system substrate-binding protein